MDNLIIRSEAAGDSFAIVGLHAAAFTYGMGMAEAVLTCVLRNRQCFDPELSIVAELGGRVIGHVLFTPQTFTVKGEEIRGVILAPIAVLPEFQKQGVGARLIREGHARAAAKGFVLSLLIGHADYYPRYGYEQKLWGRHQLQIRLEDIPSLPQGMKERRVEEPDLAELERMWSRWFQDASLAVKPGPSLTDWLSPGRGVQAAVVMKEGCRCGYIRYDKADPGKPLCVLARDTEALSWICSYLKSKMAPQEGGALLLPLPLASRQLRNWAIPCSEVFHTSPERMLHLLNPHHPALSEYRSGVKAGVVLPGPVLWPVEFDVC